LNKTTKAARWMVALLAAAWLAGCGGSNSSSAEGTVRLINATHGYGALDAYGDGTAMVSGVGEGAASDYVTLTAASHVVSVDAAGSSTTVAAQTVSVAGGGAYSVVAYGNGDGSLATAIFSDTQAAPATGHALMRIFNAGTTATAVDVYVTAPDADLSTAAVTATLNGPAMGGYIDMLQGTYRVRITGAGDRTDVRLDVPSVVLADQQIATFMLTTASGGALVDGLLVNQGGGVTAWRNTNARLRVVAGVTGNGAVPATTSDGALSASLLAPSVGSYVTVPAALPGFALAVNGVTVDTGALSLASGSDATLLVYGDAAAPQWRLIADANQAAASTSSTKVRLVDVMSGLNGTVSLSADYVVVADSVAYGTASASEAITAGTDLRLEATSPLSATPLYLATDVSLQAQHVYSLFLLGDVSAPVAVLRKDR
jgi:hypothetical protein